MKTLIQLTVLTVMLIIASCQKENYGVNLKSPQIETQGITQDDVVVLCGNSQLQRWVYYNWAKSWKDMPVPVINSARGGTIWRQMYKLIADSITKYHPKVIVLYQGENEYNAYGMRADAINNDFVKYYDEVKKQNPASKIVVVSMILSPMMYQKGLVNDVIKLNNYYKSKAEHYLDITGDYPRIDKSLWRSDSLHLNNYAPFLYKLKPYVLALLQGDEPAAPPVVDTPDAPNDCTAMTLFTGSSSTSSAFWPSLENDFADYNPVRKAYPGRTWGHLLLYTDTAFVPLHPKQIVAWCGENDWYAKVSRPSIKFTVGDYNYRVKSVINKWRKLMPDAKITIVACKKTPALAQYHKEIDSCNAYVKDYLAKMPNTSFVEVNDVLTKADYRADGMHLLPGAYPDIITRITPELIP